MKGLSPRPQNVAVLSTCCTHLIYKTNWKLIIRCMATWQCVHTCLVNTEVMSISSHMVPIIWRLWFRSRCLEHVWVIASHSILWGVITYHVLHIYWATLQLKRYPFKIIGIANISFGITVVIYLTTWWLYQNNLLSKQSDTLSETIEYRLNKRPLVTGPSSTIWPIATWIASRFSSSPWQRCMARAVSSK